MTFSIIPSKVKASVNDLGGISERLRNVQTKVNGISHQMKAGSSSFLDVSNVLAGEAGNLDALISKLAVLEDGLEKAVALYLEYEKNLSDGAVQKISDFSNPSVTASKDLSGIKDWWSNLTDWIETGVWNDSEKADRIRNDKAMASELKDLLKSKRYSKKTWKKATVVEREQILKDLFEEMQDIYGVSLKKIEFTPIESEPGYTIYGYYEDTSKLICINSDLLSKSSNYDKIMDTMAHEMRHAYQHAVVDNPEKYKVDEKTVDEWSENFNDYKTTDVDGYAAYRDQPIEKDARKFASWVV